MNIVTENAGRSPGGIVESGNISINGINSGASVQIIRPVVILIHVVSVQDRLAVTRQINVENRIFRIAKRICVNFKRQLVTIVQTEIKLLERRPIPILRRRVGVFRPHLSHVVEVQMARLCVIISRDIISDITLRHRGGSACENKQGNR